MKKFLALLLAALMVVGMVACTSNNNSTVDNSEGEQSQVENQTSIRFGFIFLHDENSTYDLNFMNAAKAACEKLNIEYVIKTNIPESNECYEAACDLADSGCNVVFADSFGHEPFVMQAAQEYPEVEFLHATGTNAHTAGLKNFHNAFASIYQGRFLAGVAAGMQLQAMIDAGTIKAEEAVMGYVGAFTYAEVISGYTSFYLGAKYVCPSVTMKVQFVGSWYDETAEKEAAELLISKGCKLISQHADSMGAPTACEKAGIGNVSYNGSTLSACPNTYIVSSRINWEPYFEYVIDCMQNGKAIDADYCGTLKSGSVELLGFNTNLAEGTEDKVNELAAKLNDGSLKVFDTSTFTVNGETLTSYIADVDSDAAYTPDTEVIADGYFDESNFRSAPYFDLRIDGIELLNEAY